LEVIKRKERWGEKKSILLYSTGIQRVRRVKRFEGVKRN
jgi:hypothetical protein